MIIDDSLNLIYSLTITISVLFHFTIEQEASYNDPLLFKVEHPPIEKI